MSASHRGIILFAHGARDPRWAEPFERLRDLVTARAGPTPVRLAFLELMQPDLGVAADALVAEGCKALAIVPIFFGEGSHLRRDLPLLVDALQARMPAVKITVATAAGEDEAVLAAVADYCFRASQAGAP
jgi:sirohydrochlorin cobaltochelatase